MYSCSFVEGSTRRTASVFSVLTFSLIIILMGFAPGASATPVSFCEIAESSEEPPVTEINLVVDDSGSMFLSKTNQQKKLWSYAKYSLEVFAALMRSDDTLNVYLLSSYEENGPAAKPVISLSGKTPKEARVATIHEMQLKGEGTPFEPVQDAYQDLAKSTAQEKWLVVMSDGEFTTKSNEEMSAEIAQYLTDGNANSDSKLQVAFLSIGKNAATVTGLESNKQFFPAKAATPSDLVLQMNLFANSIFRQRSAPLDEDGKLITDINMKRVDVFAQGPAVNVGPLNANGEEITQTDSVEVKWANNEGVNRKELEFDAVPETSLQGQLVTFTDVPKGTLSFDVKGDIDEQVVFKTPEVAMGVDLMRDGKVVNVVNSEITTGSYQVTPVVVDKVCEPLKSDELGEPEELTVTFIRDGKKVGTFGPGETVDLETGDYVMKTVGIFPQNLSIESQSRISVKSSVSSSVNMLDSGEYMVSELAEFPADSAGTRFEYVIVEDGVERSFTQAEWNQVAPEELKAVSTNSNIEFDAIKGAKVGEVIVLPRAPNGDVFAADTGTIEFEVSSEYTANGEIAKGNAAQGTVEVVDDLSLLDRFMNWWKTVGWKLLLLLLLILMILGYIFKRRFSKRVKTRPTITGTPNQVGTSPEDGFGKFQKSRMRSLLPFVADTATLKYVPGGVSGFSVMKLKAGPGKSMMVTNWKQIADKANVEINGTPLDAETRRAPSFGPSASILATTKSMNYDLTPIN